MKKTKLKTHLSKKTGKTNYKVTVHFSETSDETITDKINRLIQKECEDMSYKKEMLIFLIIIIDKKRLDNMIILDNLII